MPSLDLKRKLSVLADAAKYDASCASSGGERRDSRGGKGVGAINGMGVCHAYTPDGRCVSLLKILLTNVCIYDCAYCVNRVSSNVPRARFSVEEVVALTLDFYKRNYIEGLFLSSGIVKSADHTQGLLNRVARTLREVHDYRGYIHLKLIAGASPELAAEAGLYADRLSVNVELPKEESLVEFAPQKAPGEIRRAMATVRLGIEGTGETSRTGRRAPAFAPAGQSTQMIVGADGASDVEILTRAESLYGGYGLRRVYYSAFSPIPDASRLLPAKAPPLQRENRLYQADWLLRYYGFSPEEIAAGGEDGMLDLSIDPKLAWALKHRDRFPVDVNVADRELLLRVPGLGKSAVDKIVKARRHTQLGMDDLGRLTRGLKRARAFLIASDHRPVALADSDRLDLHFAAPEQLNLFA